jgi:hypothetical protein
MIGKGKNNRTRKIIVQHKKKQIANKKSPIKKQQLSFYSAESSPLFYSARSSAHSAKKNSSLKSIVNTKKTKKTKKNTLTKCKQGKELNPKTNRCVNVCKPNYTRNDNFKCIKNKKIKLCASGKELNPKTNRCVNVCKSNYTRNADFKCVKTK